MEWTHTMVNSLHIPVEIFLVSKLRIPSYKEYRICYLMNLFYVEMLHFILLIHTCKHQLRDPGVTCQVEKVSIPRIPDIYLKNLLYVEKVVKGLLRVTGWIRPDLLNLYNSLIIINLLFYYLMYMKDIYRKLF